MVKKGLPSNVAMRHDSHYVEDLARSNRSVGRVIPIGQIEPNPEQPRVEIGDLSELSASIKEKGVLEPLLVKPNRHSGTWMIIAGERRWRAANLAGLREVPCIELDIDDQAIAEIALIENLQRKDLTVWEEADGLKSLVERFGYKHDEIAKKISKSRTTVTELLTIANLPEDIRQKSNHAKISSKALLLEIARQFDEDAMHRFVDQVSAGNLSRKEVRQEPRPQKQTPNLNHQKKFEQPAKKNIFSFASTANNFELEIRFTDRDSEALDNRDVLRALKETFDNIKAKN